MTVDWTEVRRKFSVTRALRDFSVMALGPVPVKLAENIDGYRRGLDASPLEFADLHNPDKSAEVFAAIEEYFGISQKLVAHTHSTTLGLAQIYGGIRIGPGHEILTSVNEHFTTLEALRLRARRDGTPYRQVSLFRDSATVTGDEIVANLEREIRPWTRVLALTWVYSSDGVKLPVADIANLVRRENATRPPGALPLLFVLDGVHGFGIEDVSFPSLGCDLFAAGCHKWMFGPRGTAIICGTEKAWNEVVPLIPSFSDTSRGIARAFQPGGIRTLENVWAMADAFRFHLETGKEAIQHRTRQLCARLKRALRRNPRINLRTPRSSRYSSGIVCFDVANTPAATIVDRLLTQHQIKATESGWDATAGRTHVRLSPSILNSPEEVDVVVEALEVLSTPRSCRPSARPTT